MAPEAQQKHESEMTVQTQTHLSKIIIGVKEKSTHK